MSMVFEGRPRQVAGRWAHALVGLMLGLCLWHSPPTHAGVVGTLCPAPRGPIVLSIRVTTAPELHQQCDAQGLAALPAHELETELPAALGLPGRSRWQGFSLRQLVERLGLPSVQKVRLSALNDYTVDIPWSDLQRYDPVLAYRRDGARLGVRDKGPLLLIYPFDQHGELRGQIYLNRSIWQVRQITVH